MQYFRKELPQRTLFTPTGATVPVEMFDNDVGAIATKDPALIEWLNSIVGKQGVSKLDEAGYIDLKKKTRLSNIKKQLAFSKPKPNKKKQSVGGKPNPKIGGRSTCKSCGGRR